MFCFFVCSALSKCVFNRFQHYFQKQKNANDYKNDGEYQKAPMNVAYGLNITGVAV